MSNSYPIPAESIEIELEIKKSRFIARAGYVSTRAQAMQLLDSMKACYPDARHHCWAYQMGSPHSPHSAAMNDDGEPSGTAGKPILNVIQHKGIGDLMVVVSRYFGGVKLGAGGLVRAYSAAAEQAVSAMPIKPYEARIGVLIRCDFANEQLIRQWLSEHEGVVEHVEYANQVGLTVSLLDEKLPSLASFLPALGASYKHCADSAV